MLIHFSDNEMEAILTTTDEKKKVGVEGCEAWELFLPKQGIYATLSPLLAFSKA